ncbi:MAG TPA: RHO alpha subunit C-terminal catalytic domain-containing protein, partial [Mycobacterium sp.]|nr:RHO alpha subunit C-terminal catalytic domain-containing protein [Mycobacterium sp.]
ASYNGMIFINMDPAAEPLEQFLGDFAYYLDFYTKQSSHGLEVRGPQRWRINANWKIGAENFAGDMYHTPQTHRSVVEIGLFREPKAAKRKDGATYWAHKGGGTTYKLPPGGFEDRMRYVGYPPAMIEQIKQVWSPQQQRLVGDDGFMISAASCFPNLSFVHNWPKVEEGEDVLPFISIRTWQPISENETEVYSWFAVDSSAPEEYKKNSYRAYLMCFGSTGMFEQDDVENWVSLTNTAGGSMARRLLLNSRMGLLDDDSPVVDVLSADRFHGPGAARVGYNENNQRELLKLWADYLEMPPLKADPTAVGTSPTNSVRSTGTDDHIGSGWHHRSEGAPA